MTPTLLLLFAPAIVMTALAAASAGAMIGWMWLRHGVHPAILFGKPGAQHREGDKRHG